MKKTTWSIEPLLPVFSALVIAAAIVSNRMDTVHAGDWLRVQKEGVISCGPTSSTQTNHFQGRNLKDEAFGNVSGQPKNKQPGEKDQGNGCFHQVGAGVLCETASVKRRLVKKHDC